MAGTVKPQEEVRNLLIVLGDQLNRHSAAFDGFDPTQDLVWMAEATDEATRVPSSLPRIALFLSAMRHFRQTLENSGIAVDYLAGSTLEACLHSSLEQRRPRLVIYVEPGEWGVRERLRAALQKSGIAFDERPDRHFLCSHEQFAAHAGGRRQLRQEYFYREMRRRHRVLLDATGGPEGGAWNFDTDNRQSFGRQGPDANTLVAPVRFAPDAITRAVIAEVTERYGSAHAGEIDAFDWPVTREQALVALEDFITHRLPSFGAFQDAMWRNEPWLHHSRISAAMNLKLLDPREVVQAAERAFRAGAASLSSVEGFVRQVLGWREYVRGVYWTYMPGYLQRNAMRAEERLPGFYWTGDAEMNCLREVIGQTLRLGYAHHIQRLMVTGLFAALLGVDPQEVHEWYLAVYVDAVEWVELPNTLGMSQYADGGVMASKPYVATGRYIERMSNYCTGCRFDPALATGPRACPYTTLYWDYLFRHGDRLAGNPRMSLQLRNAARYQADERHAITEAAAALRRSLRT